MNVASRPLVLEPAAPGRDAGGSSADGRPLHQPKAARCRILAVLWIFPSTGAGFILGTTEANWLRAEGVLAGLRSVSFEQWIAIAILVAHFVFGWLAWRLQKTEPWKEIEPDNGTDLHDQA